MSEKDQKNKDSTGPQIKNKKAWFDYEITERLEAGIVLLGTEVKSLRSSLCDMEGSYARIIDEQCWLIGCQIAPYPQASTNNHDPLRKKKLLVHKSQIKKIKSKLTQRGFALIPTRVYFNSRGIAKVELGLGQGKKQYDKRQKLRQKQQKKDVERGLKKYRH